MGDIDTKVTGKPEDLRAAASWLRNSLGREVREAAQAITTARNTAEAGWDGTAGDAFSAKMLAAARQGNSLADLIGTAATKFDDLAAKLQAAQTYMHNVRTNAANAGLELVGDIIKDAAAAGAEAKKVAAFRTAQTEAAIGRQLAQTFVDTFKNVGQDLTTKYGFVVGDLIAGAAEEVAPVVMAARASVLTSRAANLTQIATQLDAQRALFAPGTHTALSEQMRYSAQDLRADAAQLRDSTTKWRIGSKVAGKAFGPVVTAASVGYDIRYGHKDPAKAITSGVAGLGAGMATGAFVGGMVGGPPGAVLGVAAGASVGLITSGAVEAIWDETKLDSKVTNGIGDGLKYTGSGIGSVSKKAWRALF